jgi:1-acyl-sn-glycerol-3-phosphate acyltransferase
MKKRIIKYSDELSDEVIHIKRKTIPIDQNYKYIKKNVLWKILEFIVYQIFVRPFSFIYLKIKFHHKVINKKVLKKYKNTGYFIYSNHTLLAGDAFIPNTVNFPKSVKIIVHPDNISQKLTKPFIEMCGALPTPTTIKATKNFINAIEYYIAKNNVIQIYPEAHIWPYYSKIRKFPSTSFKYPIKLNTPIFVMTNTFHKRKFSKTPKIITYMDGPYFKDENLNNKENEEKICNLVYKTMTARSKLTTYEYYTYIKECEDND